MSRYFLRHFKRTILLCFIILFCQFTSLYIAVLYQALINNQCSIFAKFLFKQLSLNLTWTIGNCFCNFALQSFCKTVVAFIGNNSQNVDVVNLFVRKDILIHSLTNLVYRETQASPNFLSLANIAATLFQCTYLEYIGVIPSFTQR